VLPSQSLLTQPSSAPPQVSADQQQSDVEVNNVFINKCNGVVRKVFPLLPILYINVDNAITELQEKIYDNLLLLM
jgi:hypothetical protein